MLTRIERLSSTRQEDFYHVLEQTNDSCRACMCTAHYYDEWEEKGREYRAGMFERGLADGYLLYKDNQVAAWCQAAPLSDGLRIAWDSKEDVWGITCMVIRPEFQGKGLAPLFLKSILNDLEINGCREVVAVGHRPEAYDDPDDFLELPASVCEKAGMELYRDHDVCPLYYRSFV